MSDHQRCRPKVSRESPYRTGGGRCIRSRWYATCNCGWATFAGEWRDAIARALVHEAALRADPALAAEVLGGEVRWMILGHGRDTAAQALGPWVEQP